MHFEIMYFSVGCDEKWTFRLCDRVVLFVVINVTKDSIPYIFRVEIWILVNIFLRNIGNYLQDHTISLSKGNGLVHF